MLYKRSINLPNLLEKKSFFLFGPRSVGKSTLIRQQLPQAQIIDLLDSDIYSSLLRRPATLREMISSTDAPVVIDEVQKLPLILDEVHWLIENRQSKFLLTGSSARKLKRGAANLLAGRAWTAHLFGLTFDEIDDFDLTTYLNRGGLPSVYLSSLPHEELKAYVTTYLREEILAEALVRNLQPFSYFIDIAGRSNGGEINLQSWAQDCGVSPNTIKNYVSILEDTLLAFTLPAFTLSKKRKPITREKLYFFDVGVVNALAKRGNIEPGSELFGYAFEHFIMTEVRAYLDYRRREESLSYWRSTSGFEVDLLIGRSLAIEIKSTDLVQEKHIKGLKALGEENLFKAYAVVSLDRVKRTMANGIMVYPWREFLETMWQDRLF